MPAYATARNARRSERPPGWRLLLAGIVILAVGVVIRNTIEGRLGNGVEAPATIEHRKMT